TPAPGWAVMADSLQPSKSQGRRGLGYEGELGLRAPVPPGRRMPNGMPAARESQGGLRQSNASLGRLLDNYRLIAVRCLADFEARLSDLFFPQSLVPKLQS